MKSVTLKSIFKCLFVFCLFYFLNGCTSKKHTDVVKKWNEILQSTELGYSTLEEDQVSLINGEWYNKWRSNNNKWNENSKERINLILNNQTKYKGFLFSGMSRKGSKASIDVVIIKVSNPNIKDRPIVYIINSDDGKVSNETPPRNPMDTVTTSGKDSTATPTGPGANPHSKMVNCYVFTCTKDSDSGKYVCYMFTFQTTADDCMSKDRNDCDDRDSPCNQDGKVGGFEGVDPFNW